MLRIANLQEIDDLLLHASGLVDRLDSPSFVSEVRDWLRQLESALQSNRLAIVGSIALQRGELEAAESLGLVPGWLELRKRPTRQRILCGVALEMLRRSTELTASTLQADRVRIAEAERAVRQLVALARASGRLSPDDRTVERVEYLRGTWGRLAQDAELRSLTTHVEGLLGPTDSLVQLDRVLTTDRDSRASDEEVRRCL